MHGTSLRELDIASTAVCGQVPTGVPAVNQSGAVTQLAACPNNDLSAGAIAGVGAGDATSGSHLKGAERAGEDVRNGTVDEAPEPQSEPQEQVRADQLLGP